LPTLFGIHRRLQTHAEILVWQSTFRAGLALTLWALKLGLAALGVTWSVSLVAARTGSQSAMLGFTALMFGYAALAAMVATILRRARHAPRWLILATALLDVVVIFLSVYLASPPAFYDRSLLLAFFTLQLTQIYFGRRIAVVELVAIIIAYLTLTTVALAQGATLDWAEQAWTLLLFTAGAAMFVGLYGDLSGRLDNLAAMFERAEAGDFSQAYDVAADARPDSITLVGRAYNRMREQLSTIMLTDPLSGCLNRRGFDQELTREVVRSTRQHTVLGLVAIDVDSFKRINDTFGHLAGDTVIREVGQLLRDTARGGDIVARTGGDEFIVIATETSESGVLHLANRILEAFHLRVFGGVQGQMPITASVGVVAEHPDDANLTEDLRARADEALYAAKRNGRNRVVVWAEGITRTATFAVPVAAEA
jgi:diguanylate cyclase (GGDEF)-like protein